MIDLKVTTEQVNAEEGQINVQCILDGPVAEVMQEFQHATLSILKQYAEITETSLYEVGKDFTAEIAALIGKELVKPKIEAIKAKIKSTRPD